MAHRIADAQGDPHRLVRQTGQLFGAVEALGHLPVGRADRAIRLADGTADGVLLEEVRPGNVADMHVGHWISHSGVGRPPPSSSSSIRQRSGSGIVSEPDAAAISLRWRERPRPVRSLRGRGHLLRNEPSPRGHYVLGPTRPRSRAPSHAREGRTQLRTTYKDIQNRRLPRPGVRPMSASNRSRGCRRRGSPVRRAQPGDLPIFARLGLICEPRGVRLVSGHLGDLGLGESDGEQQTHDEPTGNGFDGQLSCPRLDLRPPMDNLPEALFGDLELIPKDPMEEVVADLSVFVMRDLGPQASTVRKISEIAPMIARSAATPGAVWLLRPAVVGDVPTQFAERRQRIRRRRGPQ